jgi:HEPN domain-containing protein
LFRLGRYNYCLFFCHLAVEKALKGLVFKKTHSHALPIHRLVKLAQQAKLQLPPEIAEALKEITTWNIEARYESFKREFSLKTDKEFTRKWFQRVKEIYKWLKNQY